jgi:hypothetical protein
VGNILTFLVSLPSIATPTVAPEFNCTLTARTRKTPVFCSALSPPVLHRCGALQPILKGANGLLTNVISATLVCRLIINLRVTDARTRRRHSDDTDLQVIVSVSRREDLSPVSRHGDFSPISQQSQSPVSPRSPVLPALRHVPSTSWHPPPPVPPRPLPPTPWQSPTLWQSPAPWQSPTLIVVPVIRAPVPPRQRALPPLPSHPCEPAEPLALQWPRPPPLPRLSVEPLRPRPRALSEPRRSPQARAPAARVTPPNDRVSG